MKLTKPEANYKHTKRLIVLNLLSFTFIIFAFYTSGGGMENIGLIFLVPIFWVVWVWTFLADVRLVLNFLVLELFYKQK
jgi:hypothetical protein